MTQTQMKVIVQQMSLKVSQPTKIADKEKEGDQDTTTSLRAFAKM